MGLREIRQRLGKQCWYLLAGAVDDAPVRNPVFDLGGDVMGYDAERWKSSERRLGINCEIYGKAAASAASVACMQWEADNAVVPTAPAKKHLSADDIAREIVRPDLGATISNVLVVGTERSTLLKRTEIRFDVPEQVVATFTSLATALQNHGFEFRAAEGADTPATEIWLTAPLDGRKQAPLSRVALIGERLAAGVAVHTGPQPEQTE